MSSQNEVAQRAEVAASEIEPILHDVEDLDSDAHDLATQGDGGAPTARAGASFVEATDLLTDALRCMREAAAELTGGNE